jgi:signal transduction histidine kinase
MPAKNESELERELARLRGDLLTIGSRVAHDLRTPLGGLVSTGEVLKEILAELDPSSATVTAPLFHSADELAKLIKQVSFVTKATVRPLPKAPVQMGLIVSGVMQRLESRILKQPATVVESGSWPEVAGVASWLEFIWWNFLMNALQHAGEKPHVELGWRKETNAFRFHVSDNGGGVPVDLQTVLFQPFDTLHKPDSTRGLGLSIVRRLVELQDGNCGYEPNPNGGACFFFTLPDRI